jgi:diguanylate cyclase (GGDEF)-like protein
MPLPQLRSAQSLVVASVLLALAVVAFEAVRTSRHEYRTALAEILSSSDRKAQKLATQTTEVFDRVNETTLLIKYLHERAEPPSLDALRDAGVISRELVQFIYVADRRGFILDTTAGLSAANVSDEEFFKRHKHHADLDVSIAPVWTKPVTSQLGVPVTRRLTNGADFAGIVTATVNPAALSVNYAKTEAQGTAIGVLGADGIFRSRTVDGRLSYGERSDPARVLERAAEVHRTGIPAKSPIDGVDRFLSAIKIDKYPLYAVVAVDADQALAGYRHTRATVLGWAIVVGLAALFAGGFALTQARRLDTSRAKARKAEATFRATLEGSLDAVTVLTAERDNTGYLVDMRVGDCNTHAASMIGLQREELLGRRLCDVAPSMAGFLQHFDHTIRAQRGMQAEIMATDPHLAGRWLHHQLVPLEDGVALITRDVTDFRIAADALASLARSDALTGLSNRRHVDEVLDAARARAMRSGEPLALIYIDLDGFKAINDTFGHAAGDRVLVGVAERLKNKVRETDLVGRLGGDEFVVVAERAGGLQDIEELCGRLLRALQEPHAVIDQVAIATPIIGVAVFDGLEPTE